jgi:hypothetical protein
MARSGILYGASGTFKTTAVAHFARWIARTTGKSTLLFSSDGGGWGPCEEEIKVGMILPYKCDPNVIPLPVIRKVSQGYWPENPEEPDMAKVNFKRVDWSQVGGLAVEGLTSITQMLMRHFADKNIKTGEEATSKFSQPIVVDGEVRYEAFGMNSKGHYGGVQTQAGSMVTNFTALPCSYVLFTGHEKKYTEDGELQVGVNVPGKAITPLVPSWFGDCIHAQDYNKEVEHRAPDDKAEGGVRIEKTIDVVCRYYFQKHPDPATGAIFDAKPRVTHSKAFELRKVFPGGFFVPTPTSGFDKYLEAVDRLAQDATQDDELKRWREKQDAKLGRVPAAAKVKYEHAT